MGIQNWNIWYEEKEFGVCKINKRYLFFDEYEWV